MTKADDPILASRTRIAWWVTTGLRVGYGLFGLAMIVFFAAMVFGFNDTVTTVITICLFVGSMVLAPSLVFSYGVKAANRADRDDTW